MSSPFRAVGPNSGIVRSSVLDQSQRKISNEDGALPALDFLALKWHATRSELVRSMIVGAALAQLDRLDDAIDPNFDALVDVPRIDDVHAAP